MPASTGARGTGARGRRSRGSDCRSARIIGRRSFPAASNSASPTGALNSRTAVEILALFQALNREGVTIVVVTHDADVARHARRLVRFKDGRVTQDRRQEPADARIALAALEAA